MIREETVLQVADNSGAKKVRCFRVLGGTRRRYARVGDIIVASVIEADPKSPIKPGSVVLAVVVRSVGRIVRSDGYISFHDNSCVIIDDKEKKNPRATRIFGSIAREVRKGNFLKIVSMASEVV